MIPGLTSLVIAITFAAAVCFADYLFIVPARAALRVIAFIHGEPARQALNDPQHFGADVGRVGDRRVNLHFDREHY